jgi:DNA-directed RNA polymerase specialized sigma54-like protein
MEIQKLTDSELSTLIKECREELEQRKQSLEDVLLDDDFQKYKSKYARLTLFYDFCRGVYSVTESQLKEKNQSKKKKNIRNALINYLLSEGFSHQDVVDEFKMARTSLSSPINYHEKYYKSDKNYTDIYHDVMTFFED